MDEPKMVALAFFMPLGSIKSVIGCVQTFVPKSEMFEAGDTFSPCAYSGVPSILHQAPSSRPIQIAFFCQERRYVGGMTWAVCCFDELKPIPVNPALQIKMYTLWDQLHESTTGSNPEKAGLFILVLGLVPTFLRLLSRRNAFAWLPQVLPHVFMSAFAYYISIAPTSQRQELIEIFTKLSVVGLVIGRFFLLSVVIFRVKFLLIASEALCGFGDDMLVFLVIMFATKNPLLSFLFLTGDFLIWQAAVTAVERGEHGGQDLSEKAEKTKLSMNL